MPYRPAAPHNLTFDYRTHPTFRALADGVVASGGDRTDRGALADWFEELGCFLDSADCLRDDRGRLVTALGNRVWLVESEHPLADDVFFVLKFSWEW